MATATGQSTYVDGACASKDECLEIDQFRIVMETDNAHSGDIDCDTKETSENIGLESTATEIVGMVGHKVVDNKDTNTMITDKAYSGDLECKITEAIEHDGSEKAAAVIAFEVGYKDWDNFTTENGQSAVVVDTIGSEDDCLEHSAKVRVTTATKNASGDLHSNTTAASSTHDGSHKNMCAVFGDKDEQNLKTETSDGKTKNGQLADNVDMSGTSEDAFSEDSFLVNVTMVTDDYSGNRNETIEESENHTSGKVASVMVGEIGHNDEENKSITKVTENAYSGDLNYDTTESCENDGSEEAVYLMAEKIVLKDKENFTTGDSHSLAENYQLNTKTSENIESEEDSWVNILDKVETRKSKCEEKDSLVIVVKATKNAHSTDLHDKGETSETECSEEDSHGEDAANFATEICDTDYVGDSKTDGEVSDEAAVDMNSSAVTEYATKSSDYVNLQSLGEKVCKKGHNDAVNMATKKDGPFVNEGSDKDNLTDEVLMTIAKSSDVAEQVEKKKLSGVVTMTTKNCDAHDNMDESVSRGNKDLKKGRFKYNVEDIHPETADKLDIVVSDNNNDSLDDLAENHSNINTVNMNVKESNLILENKNGDSFESSVAMGNDSCIDFFANPKLGGSVTNQGKRRDSFKFGQNRIINVMKLLWLQRGILAKRSKVVKAFKHVVAKVEKGALEDNENPWSSFISSADCTCDAVVDYSYSNVKSKEDLDDIHCSFDDSSDGSFSPPRIDFENWENGEAKVETSNVPENTSELTNEAVGNNNELSGNSEVFSDEQSGVGNKVAGKKRFTKLTVGKKRSSLKDLDVNDIVAEEESSSRPSKRCKTDTKNHPQSDIPEKVQSQREMPVLTNAYEPGEETDRTKVKSPRKLQHVAGKVKEALDQFRATSLIEKIRSRVKQHQKVYNTPGILSSSAGQTKRRILPSRSKLKTDDIIQHINSCSNVLNKLEETLNSHAFQTITQADKWREELEKLREKLNLPPTTIAVVGDTGAGKSCLMNALLDEEAVLPTSGMRACTAVVVEIAENVKSNKFDAEIKFLSVKEWDDELKLLLSELIGDDGKIRGRPDIKSDVGIAYSKVKAVYGKIAKYKELSKMKDVTNKLGTTEYISCLRPREFRRQIDRYIDSNDNDTKASRSGGQFWPIVKQVKVKIPHCDVCSSGAVLVDLPGIRDSNAARDNIAKEYLKTCTAVWIVADITRAVDNKTAKDLLGESFRRQLLMDGQYGSIGFICTKNDLINPSEIIRALHLGPQCDLLEKDMDEIKNTMQPIKDQTDELEAKAVDLEIEIKALNADIEELKEDVFDLEDVTPINLNLSVEDSDSEASEIAFELAKRKQELAEKRELFKENQNILTEVKELIEVKTKELLPYTKQIEDKQKNIREICANARNKYAKRQIKRDFKAGLKEIKKKAGFPTADVDDELDESLDFDSDDGDDDEELIKTVESLKVFTVSSTEYLKLRGKLARDGAPTVYSRLEDTQIPSIREFVHSMTKTRRLQATEKVVRSVGRFVENVHSYVENEGTENKSARVNAKSTFDAHLEKLQTQLSPLLDSLNTAIQDAFDNSIKPKLKDGVKAALNLSSNIVQKWGAPMNRGGYHSATYRATVNRDGVYNSPTAGAIDFNQDLSEPVYSSIVIEWDKLFSSVLSRILNSCIRTILSTIKKFFLDMQKELESLGVDMQRIKRVAQQQMNSAANKLHTTVTELNDFIQEQQRTINRLITPSVQCHLAPIYAYCQNERGNGCIGRMKQHMACYVNTEKNTMYDQASQQLLQRLLELQKQIVIFVKTACDVICYDLRLQFEPFWDSPVNTMYLRQQLLPGIVQCQNLMKTIYTEANIVPAQEDLLENKPQLVTSQQAPINSNTPSTSSVLPLSSHSTTWNEPSNSQTVLGRHQLMYATQPTYTASSNQMILSQLLYPTSEASSSQQTYNIDQHALPHCVNLGAMPSAHNSSMIGNLE
ncbi:uncharacterized protein LOC102804676 [Saccoglossus kowalevskii]